MEALTIVYTEEDMRSTGIVRRIDPLGRIVIPKELRETLGIDEAPVEIFADIDSIVIKKYQHRCLFCGSDEAVFTYKDKLICNECLEELKSK